MSMLSGSNPVRASERKIKLSHQSGAKLVYIEGHGEWEKTRPYFTVPGGAEIVIYQGSGVGLDNTHGESIAKGEALASRLPTAYDARNKEYDTELAATGGKVDVNTSGTHIYRTGEQCPNYKLYAPDETGMDAFTAQPGSFVIKKGNQTNLKAIVYLYDADPQSIQFHWAACTVLR